MNLKNVTIPAFSLLILALGISCQSGKKIENGVGTEASIFKKWLADTMVNISQTPAGYDNHFMNAKAEVGKDSLSLNIIKHYEFKNTDKVNTDEISAVLKMLTEYDEIPTEFYQLSFNTAMFYSTPVVPGLKYDYGYEIKDITVKTATNTITFSYIRGRLSGKRISDNTSKKVLTYDFNWEGNKLKKELMSSS